MPIPNPAEGFVPRFPPGSRYSGLATAEHRLPDGRVVAYVRRRFIPQPDELAQSGVHVVGPGDRADLIAAARIGDPEQAWQIADANGADWPSELVVVGRRLRITFPLGISGAGHAQQ